MKGLDIPHDLFGVLLLRWVPRKSSCYGGTYLISETAENAYFKFLYISGLSLKDDMHYPGFDSIVEKHLVSLANKEMLTEGYWTL